MTTSGDETQPSTASDTRIPQGRPVIEIHDLTKHYDDLIAVRAINLAVYRGEIFGILGPNGAGKTTTLEMIEGLRRPSGGTIRVAGIDVLRNPSAVKRVIGVQLQSTALFDYLSVRELIDLFAALYGRSMARDRVDRLIAMVQLREKADAVINALSGGQQQRLSLALALVNDPKVVFLDEPTTGLDPQARRTVWDIIRAVRNQDKTVVLTTHYMEEAEVLCDRVAVMDAGQIIACDTPRNLIDALAVAATIQADIGTTPVSVDALYQLRGVRQAAVANGHIELHTQDLQTTLTSLLQFARDRDLRLAHLSTSSASLEDVFLHHTGRSLRE